MTDMHFTIVVSFWDKLALSRSLSLLLSLSTSISLSFLNRHLFVWFNSILAFSLSLSLRYSFSHWLSIHCEMFIFWIYVCIAFSDPCMLTMILRCACRHNGHCVSLILCTYAHVIIFSVKLSSNFCRFFVVWFLIGIIRYMNKIKCDTFVTYAMLCLRLPIWNKNIKMTTTTTASNGTEWETAQKRAQQINKQ